MWSTYSAHSAPLTRSGDFASQSKPPYDGEDDTEMSKDQSELNGHGKSLQKATDPLADLDPDLRLAVKEICQTEVTQSRLDLEKYEMSDIPSVVANISNKEGFKPALIKQILDQYDKITTSKTGSGLAEEGKKKTEQQIESRIADIIKLVTNAVIEAAENDRKNSTPQEKRKTVNRILKLIKVHATCYELLGVKQDATEDQIKKAHKDLIVHLHPDKNHDKSASECAKAINAAKDTLTDEKKLAKYKDILKNAPRPSDEKDTFGEEFAFNAYDDSSDSTDDDDDDDDEQDSEEEEEESYPPPSKYILKQHKAIGDIIKKFFANLEGPTKIDVLDQALRRYNTNIQADNKKQNRRVPDMYTVPLNRLGAFQYTQRIIAIDYQVGVTEPQRVQKDLRMLQAYFVNTQKRGLYQWPQAWIKFLMKPLLKRLKDLGLPQEEAKMKLSPENPRQYQPSQPRPAQEEPNQGLTDDTEMDIDDARESEPGTEIKMDDTQQKELRVLAYSAPLVVERSKDKGIDCRFWSFKQFVEVDGPNPLKVKRASEVSGVEILRCVDSKEVYNIKEKEGMYCTLPRSDFMGIEGVTWQPETGSDERTCWTWVLVKIRNINDHRPILSRTALRNWQGKKRADKEIDKFVVWLKIVPPWSPQVVKNPYHQQSYALVHQLPKKRKDNYYYDDDDGDDDMLVRRTRGHRDPALVTVIGDVADLKTAIMDIQRGMQKLLNSS